MVLARVAVADLALDWVQVVASELALAGAWARGESQVPARARALDLGLAPVLEAVLVVAPGPGADSGLAWVEDQEAARAQEPVRAPGLVLEQESEVVWVPGSAWAGEQVAGVGPVAGLAAVGSVLAVLVWAAAVGWARGESERSAPPCRRARSRQPVPKRRRDRSPAWPLPALGRRQ